jgi:hypothetical protein
MESPIKKIAFDASADKENIDARYESCEVAVPIKGIPMADETPEQQKEKAVPEEVKEDDEYEPILAENSQRFVLFPIKYHEVCAYNQSTSTRKVLALHELTCITDMANVQEGRSLLLDRRGDRSIQGPSRLEQETQ